MEKVWYYKYLGLPLCREEGRPIHAEQIGLLIPPEDVCRKIKGLQIENLSVASMDKQKFYRTEWPK